MILKIVAPVWFAILVAAGLLLHFFVPASQVFHVWLPYASPIGGLAVLSAGFFLSQWASMIFAQENTEIQPTSPTNHTLVTRGPFQYTRNPMYLGILMMFTGIVIMLGTLPMLLSTIIFFLIMNFGFVPCEEEKMQRQFGAAFTSYKSQVRRWL